MSAGALRRRLALLLALELLVTLSWPAASAAQDDILGQLQTTGELLVILTDAPHLRESDSNSYTVERDVIVSNYFGVGLQDGFAAPEGAALAWDGPSFSLRYAHRSSDSDYGEVTIRGELAADGLAVLGLTATDERHSCTDPRGCTAPTDHEATTLRLEGSIPFVGREDPEDWGSTGGCYRYQVSGEAVAAVIQEAVYAFATAGNRENLVYPPASAADLPGSVEIYFCGAAPAASAGVGTAVGYWEFVSREVVEPTLPPADFLGPDVDCIWGPVASVGESTAQVSEQYEPNCNGPGGNVGTVTTSSAWTPPPRTLTTGESIQLSVTLENVASQGSPMREPLHAGALICAEQNNDDAWACFDNTICSALYTEGDPVSGSLPQTASAPWRPPPGSPGDTLRIKVAIEGGGQYDYAEVIYHYQYIVVERPPEPEVTTPEEGPPDEGIAEGDDQVEPAVPGADDDTWIPDEHGIPDAAWEAIIAGFGGIGNIPGPEGLAEALIGIGLPAAVISVLTALGHLSGGSPDQTSGGPEAGGPGGPTSSIRLTDALGRQIDYVWDPALGGYINPQTGGMLDPTLWNEYNRNLAANRAFSDRERQRLEDREAAFDRDADELNTNLQRERREGLERSLRALEERGYALGADGARASSQAAALARQARAGLPIDYDKAAAIERFIRNREAGRSAADSGERHEVTDWDVYEAQALGLTRAIITGRNEDGSANWAGVGVRATLGAVTGGASEYVFIPASAAYIYSDSRAQGHSRTDALTGAAGNAILEILAGRAAQGLASAGGRVVGVAGQLADEFAPGLSNYVRSGAQGLRQELNQLGRAVAERVTPAPALTAAERQMQWRVTKAIAEEADDDLVRIFQGNGRQTLANLEAQGGLTPQQARHIQRALSTQVEGALDDGAAAAMQRFERETGVHTEELLVGDSGSTARGGAWSAGRSDFDRTTVPRFSEATLERYMQQTGLSREAAIDQLSEQFRQTYADEVGGALRQNTGLGTNDVDMNMFDRIRPGTGEGQTYAFGYTNARQAGWGRTRVYRPGAQPYNTSGEALVDQNALQIGRTTGAVPPDPTRMTADEFRQVVRQQWASGTNHQDAGALAKALDRACEPAQRLGAQVDGNLSRIAREIRNNPQQQAAILHQNGMTEAEFVDRSREALTDLLRQTGG